MLDRDLAEMYKVETKVFNQAIKRNSTRFPDNFRFQLTKIEYQKLKNNHNFTNKRELNENLR